MTLFDQFPHVAALVTGGGEITLGRAGSIKCAATACDEVECLAMLVKRDDETLGDLLQRLDTAIERAIEEGELTDEINGPPR